MGKGYIKIHREITDSWLWKNKPFSFGQAWVDLLTIANWKDGKELYNGDLVSRQRGTVYASKKWLADRWGWDRKKVSKFISLLEADKMVATKTTTHGTTLTIENWDKWQNQGSTDGTTTSPTDGQPMDNHSPTTPHTKERKESKSISNKAKELSAYFDEGFEERFVDSGMTEPITGEPVLIPTAETVEQRLKAMRRQRDEVLENWKLKGN